MNLTVYKITNSSNGKIYIGSTLKNFESRFQDHKLLVGGGNRGLCEWYPDINPDDLVGEVLEVIENPTPDEIKFRYRESYYCKHYRELGYELYNKLLDATHHSSESKLRISESTKGRLCSESAKEALRDYNKNHMKGNRHQSHHLIRYEGEIFEGSNELRAKLVEDGYDLTYHQVNNLVNGFFSNKNKLRYPDLLSKIEVIK